MDLLYTQTDITNLLMQTGALPDDFDRAFNRLRTWKHRGKLPDATAIRPNGQELWNQESVTALAEKLGKG